MKIISILLISGLAAGLANAEPAPGADRELPGKAAEQRPERPNPKGEKPDQRDRPTKEETLAKFDLDGDGQLSNDEKKAAREARQQEMILRRFDTDKDGVLSAEERAKADAAIAEREAKMLQRYDKDGDGQISEEERKAARHDMQKGDQRPDKPQAGKGPQGPNRQGPPRSDSAESDLPPPPEM